MKNVVKKGLGIALALGVAVSAFTPALEVEAGSVERERRYIVAKTELRAQGYDGGAKIADLLNGEYIDFYPQIYGTDTEYNYMLRCLTSTYGYVNHDYTRYLWTLN